MGAAQVRARQAPEEGILEKRSARRVNAMAAERKGKDTKKTGERGVTRRGVLRNMMWASAGLFAVQAATSGLAMFWPRRVEGFGAPIEVGHISDFPVGSITRVREGKFYLSRLAEDRVIALYWVCPHLGCTVPWVGDRFHCPCHSSVYDRTGQNIAGPAPRPMDYMAIEVRDGRLIVDTGTIIERNRHRPEHETVVRV